MAGAYWAYVDGNRVLVVQKKDVEHDKETSFKQESFDDEAHLYRKLGVTACQALQDKKLSDVELLYGAESEYLGVFENSLKLSNYENIFKKQPDEAEKKETEEKD